MSAKTRLDRLEKRLKPRPYVGSLNVFSVEVAPGEPTGVTVVWDGIGREVRYLVGTPAPLLPGGPHKIFRGPVFEV